MKALEGTMLVALLSFAAFAAEPELPSNVLPATAATQLAKSLEAASSHTTHLWRDTPPVNADGTVNGYIEIPRGQRTKWEFNMAKNARAIDRVIPRSTGGYPVNYGFVPQTVSYDGDPFDVLVLGPSLAGGEIVRGVVVGLMFMEDEKGHDAKGVLSRIDANGRPLHGLTAADRRRIGGYFKRYKRDEPGKFSTVPGWGTIAQGLAYVKTTHAFFTSCRDRAEAACRLDDQGSLLRATQVPSPSP